MIPSDPSLIHHMTVPYYDDSQRKIITSNYKELELKDYCELCIDKVEIVEKTCVYLNTKV